MEGRRAQQRMECEIEFGDSLVHSEWLKRSDYVSPDRDQRLLQGLPHCAFDASPLCFAPTATIDLRERLRQGDMAARADIA
eukprot:1976975-Pyramimonas_sp.AAC.1